MFRFLPLGGGDEIGANCYYINIAGAGIILDCGLHPRKNGIDALPDFDLLNDLPVDFVLISHAHQDHIASLPFLIKKFPYLKIYCTPQTRAVAELTLHGSVSLIKNQLQDADIKVYSHEEIDLLIQSVFYKEYGNRFIINGYGHNSDENIYCTFLDAGHIIGSAAILIEYGNEKILYTGDLCLHDQNLLPKADISLKGITTLITETTYGSADTADFDLKKEQERFAAAVNKYINNSSPVLIPVFSLGKTQEMLVLLNKLMLSGKLASVDIFTDGIARKINRVYDYNRYTINYINPALEIEEIPQKRLYRVTHIEGLLKQPCIVLAASGMVLPGTASFKLAPKWLAQKGAAIFTVGYMDPDSPGYIIANSKTGDKIQLTPSSREITVRCSIEKFSFPSHALRELLLKFIVDMRPKNIILTHGDYQSQDYIGHKLLTTMKGIKLYSAVKGKQISI
jgi:Cft2 family RNA processing exonuclease